MEPGVYYSYITVFMLILLFVLILSVYIYMVSVCIMTGTLTTLRFAARVGRIFESRGLLWLVHTGVEVDDDKKSTATVRRQCGQYFRSFTVFSMQ